jgi:hypothetical protein
MSVALLSFLSWSPGIVGCGPSGAAAKPPTKPAGKSVVPARPAEQPKPRQAEAAVAASSEVLPAYVLPFEARANPFAPPKLAPKERSATAATSQTADVKLVGLVRGGTKGAMAVVEVDGKQFIVLAGTRLGSQSDADDVHVVEIRESEIVVRQSGRQWIVSLPPP